MATNWYFQLRSLAKTDDKAAKLFDVLKTAKTEEEQNKAKQEAMDYVKSLEEPAEKPVVAEQTTEDSAPKTIDPNNFVPKFEPKNTPKPVKDEPKPSEYDLNGPAKKKRLADMGLTWEEELFLQGINIRSMKRDERILFRERIYQKKKRYMDNIQNEWQKEQALRAAKDAKDPEKIKFNNQRTIMVKIIEELDQHHNVPHIMKVVDNLTPAVMRELLENEANVSAINQRDPDFIKVFNSMY